jgi:hypothetical protein
LSVGSGQRRPPTLTKGSSKPLPPADAEVGPDRATAASFALSGRRFFCQSLAVRGSPKLEVPWSRPDLHPRARARRRHRWRRPVRLQHRPAHDRTARPNADAHPHRPQQQQSQSVRLRGLRRKYNPVADMDGEGCITLLDYQAWWMCYLMVSGEGSVAPDPSPMPRPTAEVASAP